MTIIDVINEELRVRNWSRKKLSEISGIPSSTLSLKLSRPKMTYDEIEQIAKALGIPASELMRRAEQSEAVQQ